jgi:hypothetical protein
VGTGSEGDIRMLQTDQLATAESRFHRDQQQCPVPSSYPRRRIGSSDENRGLFLGKELYGPTLVAFGRDGKNALAVERIRGLFERHVAEERVERGEARIASARGTAALLFDVVEELAQQRSVEILDPQTAGCVSEPFGGEAKQEPKGIAVTSNGVRAGAELSEQPIREEPLQ